MFAIYILMLIYKSTQTDLECINSTQVPSRWNEITQQCLEITATNLGCSVFLNFKACIMQTVNSDGTLALCYNKSYTIGIFNGYCRQVQTQLTSCSINLSRASCLSVQNGYCLWTEDGCITIQYSVANSLKDTSLASVNVCTLITSYAAVHQSGAIYQLASLYKANLLNNNGIIYKNLMEIPGCLQPTSILLEQLNCDSPGLNSLSCIQLTNQQCIFTNNKCQYVTDTSILLCNDYLNQDACLAVTNYNQTCYMNQGKCTFLSITSSNTCSFDFQVSPSVCANVESEECFYVSSTKTCNQMCRSTSNMKSEIQCKQSSFECLFSDDYGCQFSSGYQCDILGQNKLSCMKASQYCQFINGQCLTINSNKINSFYCTQGLNQQACVSLNNPSQVCQFTTECQIYLITPETMCLDLTYVNPNACKKVTVERCHWDNSNCSSIDEGTLDCETSGMNKLGCLLNTYDSCYWDEASGSCFQQIVNVNIECSTLTLVNAIACSMITYRINGIQQMCYYNQSTYNCEVLIIDNSTTCQTSGLNQMACGSIINTNLSCRWINNECEQITSLGKAVSCSALQNVTERTCALAQVKKCKYDKNRQSCTTSVPPSSSCSEAGLNTYACASLDDECYYDNNQCQSVTDYSILDCDINYPSKSACLLITQLGQYCHWNPIDSICESQTFPVSQTCASYTNVNRLFCLAYEINISKWISVENFCTYDSTNQNCQAYTFSGTWNDCGSNIDVNIHACVVYSSTNKLCYFDTDNLVCTQLNDNNLLSTLLCKQSNYLLCLNITTIGQFCSWMSDVKNTKCSPISSGGNCSDYNNSKVNANLCASTNNSQSCQYDSVNNSCIIVSSGVTNLQCTTLGLNEKACVNNTNQACYFNKNNMQCLQVIDDQAKIVNCNDPCNKLGCLASLKQACSWENNECIQVDNIGNCSQMNNQLYNAIVCASTTDAMCQYDNSTYYCATINGPITNCKSGYNINTCEANTDCDTFKNLICSQKQSIVSECTQQTSMSQCLQVSSIACGWMNNQCVTININSQLTCNQVSSNGKFNKLVCSSIEKQNEYCQYDQVNFVCQIITSTNNPCSQIGMNKQGCIFKTIGFYCIWDNNQCNQINNVSSLMCSSTLNHDTCINITKDVCSFDSSNGCTQLQENELQMMTCQSYQNVEVSQNVCKYLITQSCIYDSQQSQCIVQTTSLSTCTQENTINQEYCLNYINETCYFNDSYECLKITQFNYKCAQSNSKQQCINSRQEACQWDGSQCNNIQVNVQCTSLINVNSIACMQQKYNNQQCQFQNSQCIIPISTQTQCDGLNQIACLNNTLNACYFDTICNDANIIKYQAKCNDQNYSFTQLGCITLQTPNQLCQWINNSCQNIIIKQSDTCEQYNLNKYSTQVCASIQQNACFWNNGCVSGVATTCSTTGANKLACIGSLSGSCIFTNNLCIDTETDDVSDSLCSDPSNQNGCLNLYNGQTCQWISNTCQYIQVNNGCLSYTQVNPGVCSMTTDIACGWYQNNCIQINTSVSTCQRGFNLLSCINYTTDLCYFQDGMCQTILNINSINCEDNLNQIACLSHSSKCCQWINNSCQESNPLSSCSAQSLYSQYCCQILSDDYCGYDTSCYQLTSQSSKCNEAFNKTACFWINTGCKWENDQCQPVPNNYGCYDTINVQACIQQQQFCKYIDYCINADLNTDGCSTLTYSSNQQCIYVTDVGCLQNNDGCETIGTDNECQQKLNQIGCLDNINNCQWDSSQSACKQIGNQNTDFTQCPNDFVSRGYCSLFNLCRQDSNYLCITYTISDDCDSLNSISQENATLCQEVINVPCQYNSQNIQCQSQITGNICEDYVNQLGCAYINNNCQWISEQCQEIDSNVQFNVCEDITSKYTCLHYISTSCQWDGINHQCLTYNGDSVSCIEHIDSTTSPGVCYYFSTDYCAYDGNTCYLEQQQSICINSHSPLGCQANLSGDCYWNYLTGNCIQLIDTSLAAQMTCKMLRYSNQLFCLSPILEGQTCQWKDNLCQSATVTEVYCTSYLALNACRAVQQFEEKCIFASYCDYADSSNTFCSDPLNIYGCVNVQTDGQYCKWLGQQCSTLLDDGFNLDTHILINSNVCKKAYTINGQPSDQLEHIGVKYNPTNYICTNSESQSDLCSTQGLNYFGCLQTIADSCDWNGTQCITYGGQVYNTCEEYQTVSTKVCASISETLSCYQDSNLLSCSTFIEDDNASLFSSDTLYGLNKGACLSIINYSMIWMDGICMKFEVIPAFTTCGELSNVNQKACAQVDSAFTFCKYYRNGLCTSEFDGMIDTCDTPGLNEYGCINILNAKCRFINGQCTFYNDDISICTNLTHVNSLVCSALTTQSCKFSLLQKGCTDVHYLDSCSANGINELGCLSLEDCVYLGNNCMCNGLANLNSLVDCTLYEQNQCISKQCYYEEGICKNVTCEQLSLNDCSGKYLLETCYINKSYCVGAKMCNELLNVSDCTLFKLNGIQCNKDLYNSNHCVDQNCEHFTQDNCVGQCLWSTNECTIRECQYLDQTQCKGIANGYTCYWYNNYCYGFQNCSEFVDLFEDDKKATQCQAQSILGKQCLWQSIQPYSQQYECVSSQCSIFNNSINSCQGAELSSEVCVLLSNQSCIECSAITDVCTCMNFNNYCSYVENVGCRSNPCSSFNESECTTIQRCSYSNLKCQVKCQFLLETDCSTRTNDCYWNTKTLLCNEGTEQQVSINTIADVIELVDSFSKIMMSIYVLSQLI